MAIDERLISIGVTSVTFYTLKTATLPNVFTACVMISEDDNGKPFVLARGVSICSILDNYRKKEGKNRAYGRAAKAAISRESSLEIYDDEDRWYGEVVPRSFKAKNNEMMEYFSMKIAPELTTIGIPFRMITQTGKQGKTVYRYLYDLPRWYPNQIAAEYFAYKSEFMPPVVELTDYDEMVLHEYEEEKAKKEEKEE